VGISDSEQTVTPVELAMPHILPPVLTANFNNQYNKLEITINNKITIYRVSGVLSGLPFPDRTIRGQAPRE
jgi:hypothetical protein